MCNTHPRITPSLVAAVQSVFLVLGLAPGTTQGRGSSHCFTSDGHPTPWKFTRKDLIIVCVISGIIGLLLSVRAACYIRAFRLKRRERKEREQRRKRIAEAKKTETEQAKVEQEGELQEV